MASVIKRSKRAYQARVRNKDANIDISKTFPTKELATQWANKKEIEIHEGVLFIGKNYKGKTVKDLIKKYKAEVLIHKKEKTIIDQTIQLNWWEKEIGHRKLLSISKKDVYELTQACLKNKSNSTVNRYFAVIKHCFNFAIKIDWIKQSEFIHYSKLKEPKHRERFLSKEERFSLLKACKNSNYEALYLIVLIALCSGMRKSEILNLKWEHVNLDQGFVIVYENKSDKTRKAYINHSEVLSLLSERQKNLNSKYVFASTVNSEIAVTTIKKHWYKAVKDAGIKNFRFHDLRHTAASYVALSKGSLVDIKEILGHSSVGTTQRYAHLTDNHLSEVAKTMYSEFLDDSKEDNPIF